MRLRERLTHLFSPSGLRGPVLTLLSGTTLALGLSYLAQPILTRLYTPEAFGLFDTFVSLMAVLTPFASLRYEDALMLPEDDEDAASILWLALMLVLASVGLSVGLVVWRTEIAQLIGDVDLAPWLILVPPALLLARTNKLAEYWLTRLKRFRIVSAGQVTQTTTMVLTRIGAGLPPIRAGTGGLIGGLLVGHAAAGLFLAHRVARRSREALAAGFRWTGIRQAASRYRRFALFSTPSTLLNALVTRLPFLLLLYFFDKTVVGLFGRGFVALAIPLSLIGGAIAQVFFVHAAEEHRSGDLSQLTQTIHRRLAMLGLFPTLMLLLAGPDLFDVVFGDTWRQAGVYVQYVAPWLFLASVASPLTRLFDVLERQRLDLLMSLAMFVLQTTALVVGGLLGDVTRALLLVGLAGSIARMGHIGVMLRLADVSFLNAGRAYVRYAIFSLPFLLLTGSALWLETPWITTLVAAASGAGYLGLVAWQDDLLAVRTEGKR